MSRPAYRYGIQSCGDLVDRLCIINMRIFALESDIRNGRLSDPRIVGERALQIRDLNAERIECKNALNERLEESAPIEQKVAHASERP